MKKYTIFLIRQVPYLIAWLLFKVRMHRSYIVVFKVYLRLKGVRFKSTPRYIGLNAFIDTKGKVVLGRDIVISDEAVLLSHDYSINTINKANETFDGVERVVVKNIQIGDYSFIGKRAIIMPGVKLQPYTIVGAGAVVTKSFEKGRIILVGNPARELRSF